MGCDVRLFQVLRHMGWMFVGLVVIYICGGK